MTDRKNIPYPEDVQKAVKQSAKKNDRSESAEIIHQLRKTYKIKK